MMKLQFWGFVVASAVALFAVTGDSDGDDNNDDFSAPQTSGGNDTANVPYSPPEKPQDPIMRAREPVDGAEMPDGPEHDPEDRETERRSQGEGSGNDEESPEPPGD